MRSGLPYRHTVLVANGMPSHRVITPDGVEWRVSRKWLTRRVRGTLRDRVSATTEALSTTSQIPDLGGLDLEGGVLLLVALAALVLIVIPLILFGIELIIVGCAVAIALVGRVALGNPWIVSACRIDRPEQVWEWEVKGWRRSRELTGEISTGLNCGDGLPADLPNASLIRVP